MKNRVWFYKPQWYWHGWSTLLPIGYGHDEFARRVLVFGWTVTGRILIAVWGCGDSECEDEAAEWEEYLDACRRSIQDPPKDLPSSFKF